MTHEIARRVFIDDEIFKNEYEYMFGKKKDDIVTFVYCHNSGREREIHIGNYLVSLSLALSREGDGRYKNYEFFITANVSQDPINRRG